MASKPIHDAKAFIGVVDNCTQTRQTYTTYKSFYMTAKVFFILTPPFMNLIILLFWRSCKCFCTNNRDGK